MRRQSREIALQTLFQTEFAPQVSYTNLLEILGESHEKEVITYADEIVVGVQKHKLDIDAKIQASSSHWKMDRMATIDRNIARIAVWEMQFSSEIVKPNIAINEAIEIAKKYGSTDSASFVNGLLDQVAKSIR
jgi:N utilization substance protein B